MVLSFPSSPVVGQIAVTGGQSWRWDGVKWSLVSSVGFQGSIGFQSSRGFQGSSGFQGSVGFVGFTGSSGVGSYQGSVGWTGSAGFGSFQGSVGFQGSQSAGGFVGSVGFRGSVGDIGYQGSLSYGGFTGSRGTTGYQGSFGFQGSTGFQGSPGFQGSFGFQGSIGLANVVFGDTPPSNPNTGIIWLDTNNIVLSIWSGTANNWIGINGGAAGATGFQGSFGFTGSIGFTGSQGSGYGGSIGPTGYQGSRGDQTIMVSLGAEQSNTFVLRPTFTMRAPYALTITDARASLTQNAASGSTMVQINVNSVGIFGSNNLTINATSKTSVGNPNNVVIANPSVPDDAEITFNVTAAGVGAKGLKVVLYYT